MKALVLHGVGDLRLEERPVPAIGPCDVLVKVAWCGVCGSDIPRIFRTGAHRHPIVPGHEFSGVVAGVGANVTRVQPGARVVVFPLLWCGRCAACERGQYAQCADYDYLGSRTDGGFAEFVAAPEANVKPVPAGLALDTAALAEPTAVALHALRRSPVLPTGRVVVVFGAGPIGILTAQWARAMGARRVFVFDPVASRREIAARCGLEDVFDPLAEPARTLVARHTNGEGAAICVDAAGVPATMTEACETVARSGVVVMLGNPSADVTLPKATLSRLLRTEATLVGVWNSSYSVQSADDDWTVALEALAAGTIRADALISDRAAIAEGITRLKEIAEGRSVGMKTLIGVGG